MTNTDKCEEEMGREATDEIAIPYPDTITHSKPDHANARARIWLDGLSVFGFNSKQNQAEVGFIRPMHSLVEMTIYKNCEHFWSTWTDLPPHADTNNISITINATKKGMGHHYENATDPSDSENFAQMVNIATLHGVSSMATLVPYSPNISGRLLVRDAIFYTREMSLNNATITEEVGKTVVQPPDKIGRILGADVFTPPAEDLIVQVSIPGVELPDIHLTAGSAYEIIVRTQSDFEMDHAYLLYRVLKKPHGDSREFSLQFNPGEPNHSAPCHGITTMSIEFACETFPGGGGGW